MRLPLQKRLLLASLALPILAAAPALAQNRAPKPRLVVTIVVDQMRADYIDHFRDLFLPPGNSGGQAGGFRYLSERGACYPGARYRHFPLFTGPGHALILTGGYPYKTGIVSNDWYDKVGRRSVYCVQDDAAKVVGARPGSKAKPMSPLNLRSTTVCDELKMATGGAAKVVTLSLKDRAAILLGGRLPDATIWFDDSTGGWISSSAYCKSGQLPAWVRAINARKVPDSYFGRSWAASLPMSARSRLWKPAGVAPPDGVYNLGASFPHRVSGGLKAPGAAFYKAFTLTPWANKFVLDAAKSAVSSEKMGQDSTPDLLAINLATNDYVGHAFGPNSPEMMEVTVQTDRLLSDFFRFLDRSVPGGLANVTIALTADHGVAPIPETMEAAGFRAGRIEDSALKDAAESALDSRFGPQDWVLEFVDPYLTISPQAIEASKADADEVYSVAARAISGLSGIYAAYPRGQIEQGKLPATDLGGRLYKGFYPKVSGDVLVVAEQGWFSEESPGKNTATHGSPYAYDTAVPLLLAGFGIRPGLYREDVCPSGLAPSLCALLGIARPSACDGTNLTSALR